MTFAKTVLISEPGSPEVQTFLPYVWAVLKSHYERSVGSGSGLRWLPPIHQSGDAVALMEPYRDLTVDVLGLSCYVWNFHIQCRIAQIAKARNPGCLVVAGGPEPDYKDPTFFRRHPYIDVVVAKEGEISFTNLLTAVLAGSRDFTGIGGLYLAAPNGSPAGPIMTGPGQVVTTFDYSPYIDQTAYLEKTFRTPTDLWFAATWETTRGCPYSCSYCDWGSATMSKIRRFDMARVAAEIEWLTWMRVRLLFMADANFGILPRDTEIAEMFTAAYRRHAFPKYFVYSVAKNNPERSVAISRKLYGARITLKHELSIQHTRPEVLAATGRANISPDKQVRVVRELMADGIPIDVQLIRGIPGDTYDLSKRCLADLMEWGIHETYRIYPYQLLPNAPAADPEFVASWRIGTVTRYSFSNIDGRGSPDHVRWAPKSKTIVESSTFTRGDWVRMCVYGAFVQALHNASVARLIALYLRYCHGVTYHAFYEDLIENYCLTCEPGAVVSRNLARHYEAFVTDDDAIDFMPVDEVPLFTSWLEPYRWTLVQICRNLGNFFGGLRSFLRARYPQAKNLDSVIDFQENVIILPSYDRDSGKVFATDCDWIEFFKAVRRNYHLVSLPEPQPCPGATVEVSDRSCSDSADTRELDWSGSEDERWATWIDRVIVGYTATSAGRNNFQKLYLQRHARDRSAAA